MTPEELDEMKRTLTTRRELVSSMLKSSRKQVKGCFYGLLGNSLAMVLVTVLGTWGAMLTSAFWVHLLLIAYVVTLNAVYIRNVQFWIKHIKDWRRLAEKEKGLLVQINDALSQHAAITWLGSTVIDPVGPALN